MSHSVTQESSFYNFLTGILTLFHLWFQNFKSFFKHFFLDYKKESSLLYLTPSIKQRISVYFSNIIVIFDGFNISRYLDLSVTVSIACNLLRFVQDLLTKWGDSGAMSSLRTTTVPVLMLMMLFGRECRFCFLLLFFYWNITYIQYYIGFRRTT